jgi:hypothetical protein
MQGCGKAPHHEGLLDPLGPAGKLPTENVLTQGAWSIAAWSITAMSPGGESIRLPEISITFMPVCCGLGLFVA